MNAAAVRIAVSSSALGRPLAGGDLTQLEWLERCASELGVDGVIAALEHFPRHDAEYVAQLRKVAVDLGLVPYGLEAPGLLDPDRPEPERRDADALALATGFGALVLRTDLPAPGAVPPAAFVAMTGRAKALSRAAKAANVTVVAGTSPGTLAATLAELEHAVKDTDSAWFRALPRAVDAPPPAAKQRYPAFVATADDDPAAVASRARGAWVVLDLRDAGDPWAGARAAIRRLRIADAERRIGEGHDRNGRLEPG